MAFSRRLTVVIAAILVVMVIASVTYYELSRKSPHFGFIPMSEASSIMNANYTLQEKGSAVYSHDPIPSSDSYSAVFFSSKEMSSGGLLWIVEGHFNNSLVAAHWYTNNTGAMQNDSKYKYNQSYDGFTVSYLDFNGSSLHLRDGVYVVAVDGNYVLEMIDPYAVATTTEIANLVHAQLNAMA